MNYQQQEITGKMDFLCNRPLGVIHQQCNNGLLRLLFGLCLVIGMVTKSHAESPLLTVTPLRAYTTEQGLSQNSITDIQQDAQGFVWVATENGLNRLEASHIRLMNDVENKLLNHQINHFLFDKQQNMWAATIDGLLKVSPDLVVTSYNFPGNPTQYSEMNYLTGLDFVSEEQLVVSSWRGIFYLDAITDELQPSALNAELERQELRISSFLRYGDQLLLGTNHGLWLLNESAHSLDPIASKAFGSSRRFRRISTVGENHWLLASDKGLFSLTFENGQWSAQRLFEGDILDLAVAKSQSYFSVYDKIYRLDHSTLRSDWLFSLHQQLPRFSSYKINRLFLDNNQLLWIGTESQGLYLWSTRSENFQTLSQLSEGKIQRLSHPLIWSFTEDTAGKLWIGTDNGLNVIDLKTGDLKILLNHKPGRKADGSESIYWLYSEDQFIWAATAKGLIRINRETLATTFLKPKFARSDTDFMVYYISRLGDRLWLATNHGLVSFLPKEQQFELENRVKEKPGISPVYFVRAHKGSLWIGDGRQLRKFNPETGTLVKILTLPTSNTDLDVAISDFVEVGSRVWVSTSGYGLFELDANNQYKIVRHLNANKGLADNIIYRIIPWENRLLLTSHSGLILLDRLSSETTTFDYYDGLTSNEFNEGAAYQLRSGLFLFGTANGLVALQPNALAIPHINGSPRLLAIHQGTKLISQHQLSIKETPPEFSSNTDYLAFEFGMLDYMHPNRWTYKARLKGADEPVEQFSTSGQFVFANLPAADYELEISAEAGNGTQSIAGERLKFRISPPLWNSVSVKTAELLLLALLVFWLLYRRSQVKQAVLDLNAQLLEKEERLELALLDRNRGVWDWHRQGQKVEDSVMNIVHSADQVDELSFDDYLARISDTDRAQAQQVWLNFLKGDVRELQIHYPYESANGMRWISASGRVTDIDQQGQVLRATGTWQDISEAKKREDRLQLLTQAFESTRDVILIINQDLKIVEINKTYDKLTGFRGQKLVGRSIEEIAFNRIDKEAAEEIKQLILVHGQWQGETTLPKRNGPSFPVEVRVDVLGEPRARNHFVVTMSESSGNLQQLSHSTTTAYYDNLTGYPNQALATDRLAHAIDQSRSNKTSVVFVTIELAQFDFHLQTIGKDAVAKLLLEMGKRISSCIDRDDTLARTGQDRFAVIMENRQNLLHTAFTIKNILDALKPPIMLDQVPIKIVATAGVASFPQDGRNANQVFSRSVEALNLARKIGHHQFNYYSPDTNKRALDKIAMKARLSTALENDEFFLVYQPKFEIQSGKQIGFEVFLRWRLEDGNIVYPSQFISLAEDLNLVMPITEWLINTAFRTLRRWKDEKLDTVFAINLFPSQSVDNKLVQYLLDKLDEYELEPSALHIELSETAIANNVQKGSQFIKELALTGFRVTLDEFGKGRISLTEVSQLPLFAVKVSREYVRDIGELPASDAMLKSIAILAREQGWIPSAKGIENDTQLDFLLAAGFQIGQGYYFSDPLEESSARNFIIKHGV